WPARTHHAHAAVGFRFLDRSPPGTLYPRDGCQREEPDRAKPNGGGCRGRPCEIRRPKSEGRRKPEGGSKPEGRNPNLERPCGGKRPPRSHPHPFVPRQ